MRVPASLPLPHAWFNAAHGVPCFGAFAAHPPPEAEVLAWVLTVPWAMQPFDGIVGRPVLVLPPTLPGVAWLFKRRFSTGVLVGGPCPADAELRALNGAVTWVESLDAVAATPAFAGALRLDPCGPPPTNAQLTAIRTRLCWGAPCVLAWAGEHKSDPGPDWRVIDTGLGNVGRGGEPGGPAITLTVLQAA